MKRSNIDNNKQSEWIEMKYKFNKKWTDNKIGDEGAMKIRESLKSNTTLTSLNLEGDDKM